VQCEGSFAHSRNQAPGYRFPLRLHFVAAALRHRVHPQPPLHPLFQKNTNSLSEVEQQGVFSAKILIPLQRCSVARPVCNLSSNSIDYFEEDQYKRLRGKLVFP
jgi:hypothetical protein